MAMNPYPHRTFRYHGTEGDNDDHSDWQHSHDGHVYAVAHQERANRMWQIEKISSSTADQTQTQNLLTSPETLLNNGFSAPIRSFDERLDSFGRYESMLPPPPGPFISSADQVDEWDSLFSSTTFPSPLGVHSSTLNTYGYANPNLAVMSEDPCAGNFDSNGAFNIRPSASVADLLRLTPPDYYAMPPDGDYGNATNNDFFENLVPSVRQSAPDNLLNPAMITQHPLSDINQPNTGMSSYDIGLSFPARQDWNLEPLRNETEDTLLSVLGYQLSNDALHVSNSSMGLGKISSAAPQGLEAVEPAIAIERPLKQRKIMPKPTNSADETTETFGGKNAAVQTSKGKSQRGPLSPKKKKKVSHMRQRGVCSGCFARHVECFDEDPCRQCVKHTKSPHLGVRCCRGSLILYFECFSPDFLSGHLRKPAIENSTNRLRFINNEIIVALSTGPSHPPISLLVCEFISAEEGFLDVPDATPKAHGDMQTFAHVRSLGWGVLKCNFDQLEPRCLEHIKAISNPEAVIGEPDTISEKIMRIISCFQQTDPIARTHDLLAKAIMVYQLHFVLGERIFFSLDSVDHAVASLQNVTTGLPSRSRITARILVQQFKGAVNDLLIEITKALLDQYDGEAKDKRSETRLLCLMTHLILCMCAEQVQIQVDSFIVFRISKGGCDPITLRQFGTEVCRRLEKVILEHSWDLIRGKLKTLLSTRNPFKYGYHVDEGEVMKETELKLVNEIRQVMSDHEKEIFEKASDPYFGGTSRTPEDTGKFRKSNSDRLLSKYLRKLY